jgi:hypothetical protein
MLKPKPNEVSTMGEFQRKYSEYFENAAKNQPPINPEVVPDNLKHLIPYAEKWGFRNSLMRLEFCEAATPEMVAEFKQALDGTHALFEAWAYAHHFSEEDEEAQTAAQALAAASREELAARIQFSRMYLAEMESFNGKGIRGFAKWFEETDPEGYDDWIKS